jgi:DUF971 family protein
MKTDPASSSPLHIAVSKSRGVTIDWSDGHKSEFTNEYLRDECPCATCTGAHGTEPQRSNYAAEAGAAAPAANPFQMFKPKLRMDSIEEVGSYAIRIYWNDGHNSGIYSFDHLRSICPCPECAGIRQQHSIES